jgi:hypothetical protein
VAPVPTLVQDSVVLVMMVGWGTHAMKLTTVH